MLLRDVDLSIVLSFNKLNDHPWISYPFGVISRLGNGWIWYGIFALLLAEYAVSSPMFITGLVTALACCVIIYKVIKNRTARPRPCEASNTIHVTEQPLDRFSFPSGHTLHAVCYTIMIVQFDPSYFWALVPLSTLIALSRLILGLHYVTDVVAGATIGTLIAWCCQHIYL